MQKRFSGIQHSVYFQEVSWPSQPYQSQRPLHPALRESD